MLRLMCLRRRKIADRARNCHPIHNVNPGATSVRMIEISDRMTATSGRTIVTTVSMIAVRDPTAKNGMTDGIAPLPRVLNALRSINESCQKKPGNFSLPNCARRG